VDIVIQVSHTTDMKATNQHETQKLLLKPEEAGRTLGLGRTKAYAMIASGELPSIRLGRAVRVPMDALRQWIDEQTQRGGRTA
jgi:excisionase family DNA binding protein